MQLNHLDLQVIDVIKEKEFFENFFYFHSVTPKTSEAIAILEDEKGFVLVLQKLKDKEKNEYPDGFHIGFYLNTVEEVYNKYDIFKNYNSEAMSQIIKNNRGTMFYIKSPGNILIEINCRK